MGPVAAVVRFVSDLIRPSKSGSGQYSEQQSDRFWSQFSATINRDIGAALRQATTGVVALFADIIDLMLTHPIVAGVRGQLKSGVLAVDQEVVACPGEGLQRTIAEKTRTRWFDPSPSRATAIGAVVEGICRGGSLTEILWDQTPEGEWIWTGFVPVIQQRIRYHRETGEQGIAPNRYASIWAPPGTDPEVAKKAGLISRVSDFPRGSYLSIVPSREIPDFGKRGLDRACLSDWYQTGTAGEWWHQALEDWENPGIHATCEDDTQQPKVVEFIKKMGSRFRLVTGPGVKLTAVEKTKSGSVAAQNEFERSRERRITIAYLGASQTVAVEPEAGSKQSVQTHYQVRLDRLKDIWSLVSEVIDRDLYQPYAAMNWGIESISLAAHLTPLFQDVDALLKIVKLLGDAAAIGLPVSKAQGYEMLGWARPKDDNDVIGAPVIPFPKPSAEPAAAPLRKAA